MAQLFRLVKYYNLPRYEKICFWYRYESWMSHRVTSGFFPRLSRGDSGSFWYFMHVVNLCKPPPKKKRTIWGQGLVNVPFWGYWTSPLNGNYRWDSSWLGDVQWWHLMTHGGWSKNTIPKFDGNPWILGAAGTLCQRSRKRSHGGAFAHHESCFKDSRHWGKLATGHHVVYLCISI